LIWINHDKQEIKMSAVKIVRIVAILVAIAAAFVAIPYGAVLMALLGLAIGFMGVTEERRVLFLVMAVALVTAAGSLGSIPAIGEYLTAILGNMSAIVNAGAIAVILMIVKDRLTE
jgi:hypothetical protein